MFALTYSLLSFCCSLLAFQDFLKGRRLIRETSAPHPIASLFLSLSLLLVGIVLMGVTLRHPLPPALWGGMVASIGITAFSFMGSRLYGQWTEARERKSMEQTEA